MKKGAEEIIHGGGWRSSEHADREAARRLAALGIASAFLAVVSTAACFLGEPSRYSYLMGTAVSVVFSIRFFTVARAVWPSRESPGSAPPSSR